MQDRCCLCPVPLEINLASFDADESKMLYADFIIFEEHKFLRNIFLVMSYQKQMHSKI